MKKMYIVSFCLLALNFRISKAMIFYDLGQATVIPVMQESEANNSAEKWFKENVKDKIAIKKQRQLAQFLIKYKSAEKDALDKFRKELEEDSELNNILKKLDESLVEENREEIQEYYILIYNNLIDMEADTKDLLNRIQTCMLMGRRS